MTPTEVFSDVLRTLARHDAGFPARVRGALPEDIRRYEALSGAPVPEMYRAFLTAMGQDAGGLSPLGARLRLTDLIAALGRFKPPPGYTLIGLQDDHPNLDVYLDLTTPEIAPGLGPRVVRFESAEPVEEVYPAYPSLADMVLSTGFARLRIAALPHRAALVPTGPTWPDDRRAERPAMVAAVASRLSFERLLHSSLPTACYDKPTASMLVYAPKDLVFSVEIGAATRKALDATIEALAEPLSLTEQRIS